jgi:hypothetical protein
MKRHREKKISENKILNADIEFKNDFLIKTKLDVNEDEESEIEFFDSKQIF